LGVWEQAIFLIRSAEYSRELPARPALPPEPAKPGVNKRVKIAAGQFEKRIRN